MSASYTSVPVPSPNALMAVGQSQLEQAIYDIKRGTNVSQLRDDYKISTRERIIKEVRLATSSFVARMRRGLAGIGEGTGHSDDSDGRCVLLKDGRGQARCRVSQGPLFSRRSNQGGACTVYHPQGDAAAAC